ncbi:MAG: LysR family transcriptional regulator [Rhodococcus sp.]|uniref:LysR family transcriptional regulator n=1 Tax=Rhodococcus sp. TaxID=1831 RepID=UPI001690E24B|nr:LysR family transcriptional regulator [Rhodococcus sp. (in: high G+C Gram-positive bacteria)]NLV81187.1 LysR family transcriptional regulator [Rhodococcus sp. (in: high G+C Gram-positive bacteria)]
MDLHLVTYFVAVIDHGGITKAAQALYISQPSLSQAIRTLERRLGTTLFDRTGRRLTLTEAGRTLEVAARRILADVDRAKARVAAVRDLEAGAVEITTFSAFSLHPVVDLVRRFRARYPRIMVRVSDADGPSGVHTALRRGEAELGVTDLSAEHGGMVAIPLVEQHLVLAMHPDLAEGLPDPVPRALVRDVPLVVDLGSRADAARTGELLGTHNVVVDCAHPTATWEFVRRGIGATVVPAPLARQQMPSAAVRAIEPPLIRPVGLVLRAGEPSPAAAAFIASATEQLREG